MKTNQGKQASNTISVRFSEEEQKELKRYADFFSLNTSAAVKNAVFQKIEDWEDYLDGINTYKDIIDGRDETISHEDFWREAGL